MAEEDDPGEGLAEEDDPGEGLAEEDDAGEDMGGDDDLGEGMGGEGDPGEGMVGEDEPAISGIADQATFSLDEDAGLDEADAVSLDFFSAEPLLPAADSLDLAADVDSLDCLPLVAPEPFRLSVR
jgi:hypothetical protein